MMTSLARLLSAAMVAALLVGCGSDSSTSPGAGTPSTGANGGTGGTGGTGGSGGTGGTGGAGATGTPLDIVGLVGALKFASVSNIAGARTLLTVPTGLVTPPFDAALCPFSTPAKAFICAATNIDGMTFTMTFSLADSTGAAIAQSNAMNVASAHFIRDGKGTVYPPSTDQGTTSIGVNDHSDITVSGLASGPRALNGTTTTHYDVSLQGAANVRSSFDLTTTVSNVVLPAAGAATQWPVSGTITSDMKGVTTSGTNPVINTNTHAVLTFNGTSSPVIVTTVAGVSLSCHVDLNGAAMPTCP